MHMAPPHRYRLITEAESMLIRNTSERMDAHRFANGANGADITMTEAGKRAPAIDEVANFDVSMAATGADATTKYGFNFQLAHGSQNPVNELPPTKKGEWRVESVCQGWWGCIVSVSLCRC